MDSLNNHVREYSIQLKKGQIKKAYKGIMIFMSDLKATLERKYIDYTLSALYFGYMDMTYFAFTPTILKNKKLKIAIVFLHEECKFEVWLAGNNRKIQSEYIKSLSQDKIGRYHLSQIRPRVDSIIASTIIEQPGFDNLEKLKKDIVIKTIAFIKDINSMFE